ncbi:hypothetical protein HELRODRAFT_193356 [Helobdella robusta]|uniref:Uncharacterized protein n=1 Tax=Helobdella robusta TaxID=6412 RepID=T1FUW8_HELRO|nr:hypothetical protein HELRODRAFT_193356 [Helobdella robusta]ESN97065.1 hypothetical protein HELRODRAFT_193356 [Helobdella robusta]
MASYSTAEALRLIMQENTESDKDNVTENDANSKDRDYLLVTKRGKGTASGERGGRGRLCRGKDAHGRSDSAQPTAVGQSVGGSCFCLNYVVTYSQKPRQDCFDKSLKYVQVYRVIARLDFIDGYKFHYLCMNDKVEWKKPYCLAGVCEPGWRGKLCDIRDCRVANGACGSKLACKTHEINGYLSDQCSCKDGMFLSDEVCFKSSLVSDILNSGLANVLTFSSVPFIFVLPVIFGLIVWSKTKKTGIKNKEKQMEQSTSTNV